MPDVYRIVPPEPGKENFCPLCSTKFGAASAGIITCGEGHEFTLSLNALGVVRIDNVSMDEKLRLLFEAGMAADIITRRNIHPEGPTDDGLDELAQRRR